MLSVHELEVFAMTGRGLGTRHIAAILHLCPKTIQAYPGRIKDKLQLSDAHELIREAIGRVESAGKRNRRTTRQPDAPEIQKAFSIACGRDVWLDSLA
jgi:DNA-binding CsgD family transcriptional regulator